jgi:hypothetical protein
MMVQLRNDATLKSLLNIRDLCVVIGQKVFLRKDAVLICGKSKNHLILFQNQEKEKNKMGDGKLVIHLADGMEALLLEDLLFEVKSGEHVIDTIEWIKEDRQPSEMTIKFKHPLPIDKNRAFVRELIVEKRSHVSLQQDY